ncbi:MAG: type II toxin-antitoxin system PemK/MazF family toxin [Gammaproteobacteria bacterium]|nr:type II toxin-antitoxin system PemK/MazF family toxin [Gammaproteobacteria bacterium]
MIPDTGDILHLSFDPASGREMKGDHYFIVLTPRPFNSRFGLAWMCPITTGRQELARGLTVVTLMDTGLKVSGIVLCHQIKALDWVARRARRVDRLKGPVLDQILEVCTAIIDPARR